jgi:hypothetical protein
MKRLLFLGDFFVLRKHVTEHILFVRVLFVLAIIFGLVAQVLATTVVLQWDPNTDPTLAGYKVYYKADTNTLPFAGVGAKEGAAPIDVHNQTTATVSGLDPNHSHYFVVTAYDTAGVESPFSNIVSVPELLPPTVNLSFPANNSTVSGTVSVSVTASDNVGVSKVEFYVNGVLQAHDTSPPYLYSWNTSLLANGNYTLQAKAYDEAGNVGQSSAVAILVVSDTTAPTVVLTAPASNSTVSGMVSINAMAIDNVGVSKVEFYVNGVLQAATNIVPYTCSWNATAVANGIYALSAKAYDPVGNVVQSAVIGVTVVNGSSILMRNGDINGDGIVDIADALLALQIAVDIKQSTTQELLRGDVAPIVNGAAVPDGKIDIMDASMILAKAVGA